MKKILYITGTRADYGAVSSVLKAIHNSKDLELTLIVTGMHLLHEFGNTIDEIKKEEYNLEVVNVTSKSDELNSVPKFMSEFLNQLTDKLVEIKPDIILLLGDRAEMLAGAIAGQYLNIPIAHISGGDITGHVDDAIRNAITKLSHIHFPITEKSAERIIEMGENESRIFVVGSTSLDNIKNTKISDKESLLRTYNLDPSKPYIILIQHPVITEIDDVELHMKSTLEAIDNFKLQTIIIYPNADAGGRRIINIIKQYEKKINIRSFPNIPYNDFLELYKNATAIIGNSSCGIIESTSFGIPAINIGTRQKGREKGENVIDVDYTSQEIIDALKKALFDASFKQICLKAQTPYGEGNSGTKIASILSMLNTNSSLLDKNSSNTNILKPKFKRFNDLSPEDINFDFHMHTNQTDGKNTAEEMIAKAKELNLGSIVFTEHVHKNNDWFGEFKHKIIKLRVKSDVLIFAGIEAKVTDFQGNIDASEATIKNAEIVVGSVHRYPDENGGFISLDNIKKLCKDKAAETEFKLIMGLLKNKRNCVDIIGHPFGVYAEFFNGIPENYIEEMLIESVKNNKAIEINTKYMFNGNVFKLLKKINPYVSIGSDAHKIDDIGAKFDAIRELVR